MQTITSKSTNTLLVLIGPTGVGKTELSLSLAEHFGCSIISGDSRQFYRELKIGTAAPSEEQLKRVKHYFIGSHSIFDEYNAGQFEEDVLKLTDTLFETNDIQMLVGGSMMYIDAVCNGMDNIPAIPPEIRNYWNKAYEEKGLEFIQNQLKKLDPIHYSEVDIKNHKRIIHALEICSSTGNTYSNLRTGIKKSRDFNIIKIGLNRPRPELYNQINNRVDEMMKLGLLEEAKLFFEHRHLNTLNTVGYKELFEYFKGNWTLEFAVDMIKQDSRRYAKRQLTWFNRDKSINWFHPNEKKEIIEKIEEILAQNKQLCSKLI